MSETHASANKLQDLALTHWRVEVDNDNIAWLCIDKAETSTNVLSVDVLREFEAIVKAMIANPPKGAVIWSGKSTGFISGADINEFPKIASSAEAEKFISQAHDMLLQFESLPTTTVAMIDGFALGGGLELAMACDYRVAAATDDRTLGLPEVQLGLHPGFGGTVRAVQLIGVSQAMPLMLTGKSIAPRKGLKLGLIDAVCETDQLRATARKYALQSAPSRSSGFVDKLLHLPFVRPIIAGRIRAGVRPRAREDQYPAPYAMIDLWQQHGANPASAYKAEAQSFGRLIETDTSRNLVRVYFYRPG